jgi:hypothetical protein
MKRCTRRLAVCLGLSVAALVAWGPKGSAQPLGAAPDTRSARERAPIDITGQWVAVVTEDWRWRMITPPVGDTASIPLNAAGRGAAAAWNLDRDTTEGNLCRAFGPPGLIRQPTRIRVSWEGDETLRLEFDAGRQTRRLHFGQLEPSEARSLQGHSAASWYRQPQSRGVFGGGTPMDGGALHVHTTRMTPGYLRPNGVPYSERATVKEFFNSFTLPGGGGTWLIVTTVVADPVYLTTELVMSSQFKKEAGRAGWDPRPCEIAPPLIDQPVGSPGPFG